jgi:pectate lyase
MKNMLYGHTDGSTQAAIDAQFRITLHHNFIESTDGRNPSLRYGVLHMYNNYFKDITDYGMASRQGAHALIQNNLYENVNIPITTNKFTGEGYACESGNIFTNCGANSITQTGCDFWTSSMLPYSYTLDAASSLSTTLPANVGVGKITITPPGITTRRMLAENSSGEWIGKLSAQNYPNPFSVTTTLRINSPSRSKATITLYDGMGKKTGVFRSLTLNTGSNEVSFSRKGLAAGVYFYVIETQTGSIRNQMVIQ